MGLDSCSLSAGMAGTGCVVRAARSGTVFVSFEGIAPATPGAGSVCVFVSAAFSSTSLAVIGIGAAGLMALEGLAAAALDGNRIPQNPGDASVNSNSTYPLALE